MPIKIIAWKCAFNCGYKCQTVKKRMVEHEKWCKNNPENKSCATCIHERFEQGNREIGYNEPSYYWCFIDKLPEHKSLVLNCEFWQKK